MDSIEMCNEENCLTYDDFFFFFGINDIWWLEISSNIPIYKRILYAQLTFFFAKEKKMIGGSAVWKILSQQSEWP